MPRINPRKRKYPFVIHGNYVGPGNPVDDEYIRAFPPVDATDEAAMFHDMDPAFKYFKHTPADDRFMARLEGITPGSVSERVARGVALGYHRVKRSLFPHVKTDNLIINKMDEAFNPFAYRKASYRIGGRIRPVRRPAPESKYGLYGSHGSDELNGQLNNGSPDTAYMCMTSFKTAVLKNLPPVNTRPVASATRVSESGCIVYHVAAALLRHILSREFKIDLGSHDDPVMPYRVNSDNNATTNAGVLEQAPRMDPCSKLVFIARHEPFGSNPIFNHVYTLSFTYNGMTRGTTVSDIPTTVLKTFRECVSELACYVIGSAYCGATFNNDAMGTRGLYGYCVVTPDAASNAILKANPSGVIQVDVAAAGSDLDNITARGTTNSNAFVTGWSDIKRLDSTYVKAYSTANLRIQNVSLNDDGDSSLDKANTNTLVGMVLKFKDPYPVLKTPGCYIDFYGRLSNYKNDGTAAYTFPGAGTTVNTEDVGSLDTYTLTTAGVTTTYPVSGAYDLFSMPSDNAQKLSFDVDGDGLTIPNSALTGQWVQLPEPGLFLRCSGMNKFLLKPGEMKNVKIEFKFDGKISEFSKGLCLWQGTANRLSAKPAMGTSVMLGFEKYMQYSTSTIAVNYQLRYNAGAIIKRNKKLPMTAFKRDALSTKKLAVSDNTIMTADVPEPEHII